MVLQYSLPGTEKSDARSEVSPQFLLRLGGLPIDSIDDLHFAKTARQSEVVLAIEQIISTRRDQLVDVLHEAVNAHKEDQKLRRKLLDIKRDVFNQRAPGNGEAIRQIAAGLDATTRDLLYEWVDLWEQRQEKIAAVTEIFLQELYEKRALLKRIIEELDFRKGVFLSSPILDQAIHSYLAADNHRLNREARTVERSLVEYLLRTACKTSPFSTLTSVCIGIFDEEDADAERDVTYDFESLDKKSFTRLNVAILSRLSMLIFSSTQIRHELPVQVTPGWRIQKNRVRYLRRKQELDDTDPTRPMALDTLHEDVFYLPIGPLLKDVLDVAGDGRTIKLGDLVKQLCASERYERTAEEVDTYLQHLLRLGFLIVPSLHLDIHSDNPLADYRKGLSTIITPLTQRLANLLGQIESLVMVYATADLARRREILAEVKQLVQASYRELDEAEHVIPRTMIYEDTTVSPRKLAISPQRWQELRSNLAEFQRILPVFDVNLQRRLVTKGYFRARFGAGGRADDFLSFADDFNQEFFDHFLKNPTNRNAFDSNRRFVRHENHFKLPEIEMLDDARQAVADYVTQVYSQRASGSSELILDDDFIRAVSPHVPENLDSTQSHTFFAQFARTGGEPLLIINRVYTGLTLMFSRFAHFFAGQEQPYKLIPRLRATLMELQPPNAVFAELKGGYETTNLNLHPSLTAYELVCPGDLSMRPEHEQIALSDLAILDDAETNTLRLYSRRLGKEVIPIYLGFLMPMALPEIQQILLNFSHATLCPIYMWLGTNAPSTGNTIAGYPRIRYKNLVLHRKLWKLHPQYFPQRESKQSDADYYLNVLRWQKENGVPSKVFVTPDNSATEPTPDGDAGAGQEYNLKLQKPLYVDFSNFFSVALLEATARGSTNRMVMTEMLPHRDELWFEHDGHPYVSEFVLEMNRKGGSHV